MLIVCFLNIGTPPTPVTKITEDPLKNKADDDAQTKPAKRALFQDEPSDLKKQKGKKQTLANKTCSLLFHKYRTITSTTVQPNITITLTIKLKKHKYQPYTLLLTLFHTPF